MTSRDGGDDISNMMKVVNNIYNVTNIIWVRSVITLAV